MDYVYICKNGDNEELRYSIRSVEKHAPEGRVWLVGGKPDWYVGDYIPRNNSNGKQANAIENLTAVVESNEISETFVLMNDDFFIINPIKEIKTYHGGSLIEKIKLRKELSPRSKYNEQLLKTYRLLKRRGIEEILDYDIHVPMLMTKSGLASVLELRTQWRSTYGNMFSVGGTEVEDVKVYSHGDLLELSYDIENLKYDYLSTDDTSFIKVKEALLEDLFKDKSKHELYNG
jgi:hypothetical protein